MDDREEFRSSQVDRMEALSLLLYRALDDAQAETIGGDELAEAIEPILEQAFYTEYQHDYALRDNPAAAWRWAWPKIKPGLTAASDLADPRLMAHWLGTAIVNAAQMASTDTTRKKMWLSRRDDKVRPFHVDADGQTVPINKPFVVCNGRKVDFPGQPVGKPDCWINCRCVVRTVNGSQDLRVEPVTAAADPGSTGVCIVAIAAPGDPIWEASSEPIPHMTMIWLGSLNLSEHGQSIKDALSRVTEGLNFPEGVEAPVTSRETLGDDEADVAMLDPGPLRDVRDSLLDDEAVRTAYDATEQYPEWTPHTTLGYPNAPATGAPSDSIRFDRLALWDDDYAGEEFPMTTAVEDEVEVEEPADVLLDDTAIPWHGVLVPEGVASGDGRKFSDGAVTWRELPLPLLWQERSGMGHDGSVIVGQIADIWREGNLIHASGTFANTEEAEKAIGLLAEGHMRGVSVDIDSADMAVEDEESEELLFTQGRISAATLCSIPAFAEAFVSLGAGPGRPEVEEPEPALVAGAYKTRDAEDVPLPFSEVQLVSEAPWDGSASRFTPEQWKSSCCLHLAPEVEPKSNHKLPIKEPGGALSRAGTHAAAGRFNQVDAPAEAKSSAKSTLRGAYKTLGEEPPEVIKAEGIVITYNSSPATITKNSATGYVTTSFGRGPGWVTDPVATKRIHDYWTKPGNEGYAKIAWGTPGDFRRLRAYLSKYIGAKFLNRTTAQWHHDALGYWPGELGKPGNPVTRARHAGETVDASVILASAETVRRVVPGDWFSDPGLESGTAITITDDGRIFGHLATWGVCHIGIPGTCIEAPRSATEYAYFRTGVIETSDGPVACGQITMDTGHAPVQAGAKQAAAHYDNTGAVVADVAAGEDEYGIWVAGALRPGLTDKQISTLRAGALSGDWRAIRANLELVAALVVNVPGFPIPRIGLAASGGVQTSLVAAGIPMRGDHEVVEEAVAELVTAVAIEVEARASRRARAAALLDDTRELRVAALVQRVEV